MKWRDHPILKPPTVEEMAVMEPDGLAKLHRAYHEAILNAERDPYRYGFVLDNWRVAERLLQEHDTVLVSGGNRCLASEQVIDDPVSGASIPVSEITGNFHVTAWDQASKSFVTAVALRPFRKPAQRLFLLSLSNGQTLSCSEEHRVLTPSGWKAAGDLQCGSQIVGMPLVGTKQNVQLSCLPNPKAPILGTSPLGFLQDAGHWNQTVEGSQCDCPSCRRLGGGQLRSEEDSGQGVSPSQGDALGCTSLSDSTCRQTLGGAAHLHECTLDGLEPKHDSSHCDLQCGHLSTQDDRGQIEGRCADKQCPTSCTPCKSALEKFEDHEFSLVDPQFAAGSGRQQCCLEFRQQDNQCNLFSSKESKEEIVTLVKSDYLRTDDVWDFEVPEFHNYVAGGVVNHNSSKTQYGAWQTVKCCLENQQTMIVCFAQNAELSVLVQQSAIFHHLPEELKSKKLGQEEYISFTKQNGFAGNSLIFPNGSRILFKTYSQYQQNQTVLEGLELGSYAPTVVNLGAWCDEYLGGPDLINTLGFRLATRNAKMLLTFTPIDGYTETVRLFLAGAKTLESKPAEMLNGEMVPTVQECVGRDAAVLYLHTKDNPFAGYDRVAKEAANKGREWIMCRLYGVPTKSIAGQFPLFSREVNVIKHEQIPRKDVTRYMVLDPAGRKNWFMGWIAVDASDTYYLYREWPDVNVGDWAKWHGNKWIGGEGAKGLGYGIRDYVDLICGLEEGETIYERLIDPRLGAAKYQSQNGASSIIEDLADAGLIFVPAPGLEIEDGIQALQNKMSYNPKAPIDALNRPHFYVSDRCENTIAALQEYTGEGGSDEAWKDPIDILRYAAIDGIRFVDPKRATVSKRAGGY